MGIKVWNWEAANGEETQGVRVNFGSLWGRKRIDEEQVLLVFVDVTAIKGRTREDSIREIKKGRWA